MERALRVISVERGYDPGDFTLVSFGGAGGLHACNLARALGIPRVLIPPAASVLSAFGMLTAEVIKDYVQTVMLAGDTDYAELERLIAPLAERGAAEIETEGVDAGRISLHRQLDIRYAGQSYELTVPLTPAFVQDFHAAHHRAYGHSDPAAPIEIVNLRLKAVGAVTRPELPAGEAGAPDPGQALLARRPLVTEAGLIDAPFYQGEKLRPGHRIAGPAVIVQSDTTILLGAGDVAEVDGRFNLVVEING